MFLVPRHKPGDEDAGRWEKERTDLQTSKQGKHWCVFYLMHVSVYEKVKDFLLDTERKNLNTNTGKLKRGI